MQKVKHEISFSSIVSDSSDVDEFVVEFTFQGETTEYPHVMVTKNFSELIDFFNEMEE